MQRKRTKSIFMTRISLFLASFVTVFTLTEQVAYAANIPPQTREGQWDFLFTGNTQTFTVPSTGYYGFELWGAQGGDKGSRSGGKGGYVKTVLSLNEGDVIYINVGGKDNTFNGGGKGTITNGGGATDIRVNGNAVANRKAVAGGGGGASPNENGKPGGSNASLRINESIDPASRVVPHVHEGDATSGGPCYKDPVYHVHTGDATNGGGCYTAELSHSHQHKGDLISAITSGEIQYVDTSTGGFCSDYLATEAGECYNTPVEKFVIHTHKGDSSSGGECYNVPVYKKHAHSGNSSEGGGCYTKHVHNHNTSCYGSCSVHTTVSYYATDPDGVCYLKVETHSSCGRGTETSVHKGYIPGSGDSTHSYLKCDNKPLNSWSLNCGKTAGTAYASEGVDHYNLGCTISESQKVQTFYALDCGQETGEILGYFLGCKKTEKSVEKYNLTCSKTDDGGAYEGEAGSFGGGGGYIGGTKGLPIYHKHIDGYNSGCYTVPYQELHCTSECVLHPAYDYPASTERCHIHSYHPCEHEKPGHRDEYVEHHDIWVTYYDLGCGKTTNTIDGYHSGYGGSSWVTSEAHEVTKTAGVRNGNGLLRITTVYGIEYNLNQGSFSSPQIKYIWYGKTGSISNPEREGYTFMGWDIENMDSCVHTIGNTTTTNSTATRIKETAFKNLRCMPGNVKFTAIWRDETKPAIEGITYVNEKVTDYNEKTYVPGKWTGQTVIATVKASDMGSGVLSGQWSGEYFSNMLKLVSIADVDPEVMNTNSDLRYFQNTKSFTKTGVYSGKVIIKDNANTENEDHISHATNIAEVLYGDIKIDKDKPSVVVEYQLRRSGTDSDWKNAGTNPTNEDVIVKVSAYDPLSGLHAKAYSWDNMATWIDADSGSENGTNEENCDVRSFSSKTFKENTSGYVYVRDQVGNITKAEYVITGIDKKAPFVYPEKKPKDDDVPGEPLPRDPDLPEDYDYGEDTDYTFQNIGTLTYDWVNAKLNKFVFKAVDEENVSPSYSASGIARMELFKADKNFLYTKDEEHSVKKVLNGSTLSYISEEQGILRFVLEVEDKAQNITKVKLTVKVDKTAPIIPNKNSVSDFEIEEINLNKYGIDQVEERIKDPEIMKRSFLFTGSDYNNEEYGSFESETDSSGISSFKIKLYDADNKSDYKEYEFGYSTSHPVLNTDEFLNSPVKEKALLKASFGKEINTFADFPGTSAIGYEITIKDRAGNETVYQNEEGNEIKNFSIKAVIHYASVSDEDNHIDSNSMEEFNILEDDSNGKLTVTPYFMTGDFGYIEAWTIGYVPSIKFDFNSIGLETVNEIKNGSIPRKYNLGILSDTAYMREINASQATKINANIPDYNGVAFASHYGMTEKALIEAKSSISFFDRFGINGTVIRIPPYYKLVSDGSKREDGTTNYQWEVHKANIIAIKGHGKHQANSEAVYVIWDSGSSDIHHRITHES